MVASPHVTKGSQKKVVLYVLYFNKWYYTNGRLLWGKVTFFFFLDSKELRK